jgi:NAD(P)-dependent dehydrogenase (short-subunit alcohol dehydrogenase family)
MQVSSMRKTAVVTGSTQGLGLGIARALLARGVNVVLCGPDDRGVQLPSGEGGAEAVFLACDITRRENVEALWRSAEARFGAVDVWINNAGLALTGAPLVEQPIDDFARMTAINLVGTLSCCQVAAAGMRARGGVIFNMLGAGWDYQPVPGMNGYATSKAALTFMTQALAQELAGSGVAMVGISPGLVLTEGFLREHAKVPDDQLAGREAVVNILADYVETLSDWIAEHVLRPPVGGETLVWLTPEKIAARKAQQPPRELIRNRRIVRETA